MELVKGVPGLEVGIGLVTGRRNSTDTEHSLGGAEFERNLGPKEQMEKRRQKKRRDTAVRYF
eukprot:COSAG02_NODE_49859_length_324_cov_0.693333_1_plen_61_part_01